MNQTYAETRDGLLEDAYQCYLTFANDGQGGDITRNGEPLLTFEEWLNQ